MGEQGWQGFLDAEGVEDWVVLHGGATAAFRVRSIGEAARLALAVAGIADLEGSGALLTIADAHLTIRLTRDMWQLEPGHGMRQGSQRLVQLEAPRCRAAEDSLQGGELLLAEQLANAHPLLARPVHHSAHGFHAAGIHPLERTTL